MKLFEIIGLVVDGVCAGTYGNLSNKIDHMIAAPVAPILTIDYWIPVVGVTFEDRQAKLACLTGDETLVMTLEHYNDYPNAIGVYANGVKIGHVPDKHGQGKVSIAKMIRDKMNQGKNPTVVGWVRLGGTPYHPKFGVRIKIRNGR